MTAPVPDVVAVNAEVHVAEADVPPRVHVVKLPATPIWDSATVPAGVRNVPAASSVTVTVQVEAWFATTGVVQFTVVAVVRRFTVMLVVPLLTLWTLSP